LTVIFRKNIVVRIYATLIMSTSKILVITPNYVDSLVETLCLCILYAFKSGSTARCFWTTSRHVVPSFYYGNSPIFSLLCYCSALFHPVAG